MSKKQRKNLVRILIATVWLLLCNLLPITGVFREVVFLGCYLFIGYDVLRKALLGILAGNVFSENFLMAVATLGAIALAIYGKTGDYNEAIAVMLFYQIGEWFQSYAVGKSRKNISALMDIRPDCANIIVDGKTVQVPAQEVAAGSEILIQPGEKIPLDGVVVTGSSSLDTSALTGESLPREVGVADKVLSGCINLSGLLVVKTTSTFENTTVSQILELVEQAGTRKSKSEHFVSRFARVYTPFVCVSALALAVLPPLFGAGAFGMWLYRALTFLVISCPCALVISVPLSFFAGIGGASKAGILIKGSNFLERLAKVKCVVFDKTGTLTKGAFTVTDVLLCAHFTKEQLLEYGALAESSSTHPIARSICQAYPQELEQARVKALQEYHGFGVVATVDDKEIVVGNPRLMKRKGIKGEIFQSEDTAVHIGIDGIYAGCFCVADVCKPQSRDAVRLLKKLDVQKTVMLTGDNRTVAEKIARTLDMDEVFSELLPADKVTKLEEISSTQTGMLAFVGDGINDAPVLTRADVGIAMGALGSDAAIEAADVVLMDDDPQKVAKAIQIARRCMAIVHQNVWFAIGTKLLCLILGAVGIADMWLAIFADVGVMVLAVLNAIRALRI